MTNYGSSALRIYHLKLKVESLTPKAHLNMNIGWLKQVLPVGFTSRTLFGQSLKFILETNPRCFLVSWNTHLKLPICALELNSATFVFFSEIPKSPFWYLTKATFLVSWNSPKNPSRVSLTNTMAVFERWITKDLVWSYRTHWWLSFGVLCMLG